MRGTLKRLLDRDPVKTLRGLHAKIYIVDDQAIVTSANLTETAFTKRREIGILLGATESNEIITIVNTWWDNFASEISPDTVEKWPGTSEFTPEAEGDGLPTLWGLPHKPLDSLFASSGKTARDFASYRNFLKHYNELAQEYATVQRLWPNAPLFIEMDAFLNHLFHEAEGTPARTFYEERNPRTLTASAALGRKNLSSRRRDSVPAGSVSRTTKDYRVQRFSACSSAARKGSPRRPESRRHPTGD